MKFILSISLFLVLQSVYAQSLCPQNIFVKNVLSFEIDNQYDLQFAGYEFFCQKKCQFNKEIDCSRKCQHQKATLNTTQYLAQKHGQNILKCLDVKSIIVQISNQKQNHN